MLAIILIKSLCYTALALLHVRPGLVPRHRHQTITGLLYLAVAAALLAGLLVYPH